MKKVLIYSNTGLSSKQIGLTAEVIANLNEQNASITLVKCDNVLDNCYFNRTHNILACASCQGRSDALINQIDCKNLNVVSLKKISKAYAVQIPKFKNLQALLDYTYKGHQIGRAVSSSIISYKRDYELNSDKYGDLIALEIKKSINVLLNFEAILAQNTFDEVYLFNGRFSEVYPVLSLCEQQALDYFSIEAGAGKNVELFKNHLPHSIVGRQKTIASIWSAFDKKKRVQIAQNWFHSKRNKDEQIEKSFTKAQETGLVPDFLDQKKKKILILNSSEDELKVMEEWQTPLFKEQNQAIDKIVSHYKNDDAKQFILRVHPNLGKVDNQQIRGVQKMEHQNLHIIGPNEKVDTYALIEACDIILVFASATGLEATFMKKPSILFGKSFYMQMNAVYEPKTYTELYKLLDHKKLPAKPQENTYKYALYMSVYGTKTKYFKLAEKRQESTFKGEKIKDFPVQSFTLLFKYLSSFSVWISTHRIYFQKPLSLFSLFKYK